MSARLAACQCGGLRLTCAGEPRRVSMCHCLDCQRRTGSLFSVAAFFDWSAVTVLSGAPRSFTRGSASGHPVRFHFCGECGSKGFWEAERMPHLIGVAVGAFADPCFPPPEQSVWTADRHAWLSLPDGLPVHDASSPPRPAGG